MKRAISLICTVLLVLGCLPMAATNSFAAAKIPTAQTCAAELENLGVNLTEFEQSVREQIESCEQWVDISDFNIPYLSGNYNLNLVVTYIRYYMPEYFHIVNFQATQNGVIYPQLYLTYDIRMDTPEEYTAIKEQFNTKVDEMLSGIANASLSQAQTALIVHDRLIESVAYDMNVYEGTTVPDDSYTMYGVFFNRIAVCDGYSKAYSYMLNMLGIQTMVVTSSAMQHAWNLVYIDGKPYYVDCTWDDPIMSFEGTVMHNNFLRSADGIAQTGHTENGVIDYDPGFAVDDTKYDSYYWQNSKTGFQLVSGKLYYLDNSTAQLMCADSTVALCSVKSKWMANATQYYTANFSKLDSIGNSLFFSLADGVYRYHIKSGKVKKIFTPDSAAFGDYYNLYGFRCEGRTFCCYLFNTPNCDYTVIDNYLITHEYAQYTLDISYDESMGSVSYEGDLDELSDITLTAACKPGCTFEGFFVDGVPLIDNNDDNDPLTLDYEISADTLISAIFSGAPNTTALIGQVDSTGAYKALKIELFMDGVYIGTCTTEPGDGVFRFTDLSAGSYTLFISGDGLVGTKIEGITIADGEVLDLRNDSREELCNISSPLGDINADSFIDMSDISMVLCDTVYGKSVSAAAEDVNGNGAVGADDLAILLLAQNYAQTQKIIQFQ